MSFLPLRPAGIRTWLRSLALPLLVFLVGTAVAGLLTQLELSRQRELQQARLQQFVDFTDVELRMNLQPAFFIVNSIEVFIREAGGDVSKLSIEPVMRELGLHTAHMVNLTVAPGNRMDYIVPRTGNDAAIGKRYEDLPQQWPAIKAIIASKQPRLIGPISLIQGGRGIIYRHPVFLNDRSYWGLVSVVLDAEGVLSTSATMGEGVTYALREVNAKNEPTSPVFWGDPLAFRDPYMTRLVTPPGGRWQLAVAELPVDPASAQTRLFGGTGVALLLAILTFIATRAARARRLAAQQLASVFASARDGVAILDPQGRVRDVNGAMSAMFGFERDHVVGRHFEEFGRELNPDAVYQALWSGLSQHGFWRGELTNRHADGSISTDIATVSAVCDAQGQVTHYVVTITSMDSVREDVVTGLPSRNVLDDRISQAINQARTAHTGVVLFVVGLDHFRDVNESYGHRVGDLLLREVGQRIRDLAGPSATVARVGGDEFAVILQGSVADGTIETLLGGLLGRLNSPVTVGTHELRGSASIGVSVYPDDASDAAEMFRHAGQALRRAKDDGRNRFAYFSADMQAEVLERSQLAQDLWRALEAGEIVSYFQPVIDLRTGKAVKAEALARWHHPDRGLLGPGSFVPIAERLGIISELGQHLFDGVVEAAHRLQREHPGFQVTFNMSPLELRAPTLRYHERLLQEMADGLLPEALVIEITEGVLVEQSPEVAERLRQLRTDGLEFAVDDFGTGYSSLSYLQQLDVDYLKIDRSFISGLAPGNDAHALCEAVIDMAHRLRLRVVAEGVETEQQRDLLVQAGCDFAQGFLFARPMPGAELRALLQAQEA